MLLQHYEDAFTELVLIGQKTWDNDSKKLRFVPNAQNIGMVDSVLKNYLEICLL
jgi:hypothetical protein